MGNHDVLRMQVPDQGMGVVFQREDHCFGMLVRLHPACWQR